MTPILPAYPSKTRAKELLFHGRVVSAIRGLRLKLWASPKATRIGRIKAKAPLRSSRRSPSTKRVSYLYWRQTRNADRHSIKIMNDEARKSAFFQFRNSSLLFTPLTNLTQSSHMT